MESFPGVSIWESSVKINSHRNRCLVHEHTVDTLDNRCYHISPTARTRFWGTHHRHLGILKPKCQKLKHSRSMDTFAVSHLSLNFTHHQVPSKILLSSWSYLSLHGPTHRDVTLFFSLHMHFSTKSHNFFFHCCALGLPEDDNKIRIGPRQPLEVCSVKEDQVDIPWKACLLMVSAGPMQLICSLETAGL